MAKLQTIEDFLNYIGGFDLIMFGGCCPYQMKAVNPFGDVLYLRAKGNTAKLYLGKVDENNEADINFEWEENPDLSVAITAWTKEEPGAGYIGYKQETTIPYYVFYTLWSELKNFLD